MFWAGRSLSFQYIPLCLVSVPFLGLRRGLGAAACCRASNLRGWQGDVGSESSAHGELLYGAAL